MKNNLLIKAILFYLIGLNLASAQVLDSCTFVQRDSIITIEMESANLNGGFWVVQNDVPGYTGSGYIQYIGGDATGVPGKSQLTYTFRVKEAGRHSFKMRAFRENYHDNDVWVKFPHGGVITKIGNDSTGTMGSNWFKAVIGARNEWYGFVKTQHLGTAWGETFHDIYVDFPEPGVYTVQFSGRASMFRIDRFMLYYQKSSFFGMNPDNTESAKENCQPYNTMGRLYLSKPLLDYTIRSGETWTYTIPENTFEGGTSIGYSSFLGNMFPLPSWLSFDQKTRTFTANPAFENGGKYTVLVKAEDNGTHAVDAFTLNVLGNRPPEHASTISDTTAFTGQNFTYDLSPYFSDADDNTLNYSARSGSGAIPSWLSLEGSTLSGTPSNADIGNDTIYVTISDDFGGSLVESFIITVKYAVVESLYKNNSRKLYMYPNPADQILNIRTEGNGKGSMALIDNMGKIIFKTENVDLENDIILDLESASIKPGIYTLKIKSNNSTSEYNGLVVKK
ncbi:putative Ig domain-containing protein [Sporocytophaga myxococcoides]|uniref:putative Ig domain-containing protein n=1 Tax=Sporocytophaga myxococcoides TaxID=153721 RepID=UPI00048F0C91|nr:putative Ig domain-containing protein [Sporocytophaga myxococcoides]